MVKKSKHVFFDDKITEITNKKCCLWELMNQVKKCKLPAVKVIQFNRQPYIELNDLQNILYNYFNSALSHKVNLYLLDEIPDREPINWTSFAREELINTIEKCNNSLASDCYKMKVWTDFRVRVRTVKILQQ